MRNSMSNLPPGCTNKMIEDHFGSDGPCDVCGRSVDDCICPECPECGGVGDPRCYEGSGQKYKEVKIVKTGNKARAMFRHHGMKTTKEQRRGRAMTKVQMDIDKYNDLLVSCHQWLEELKDNPDTDGGEW